MNDTYREIYKKLIGDKYDTLIISYKPREGRYKYQGYSHQVGASALDDIVELIIDDMFFYAFSESEILKMEKEMKVLSNLRAAAKYAYSERIPKREQAKSDGLVGEVLLDIFIQLASQDTKKLIARAKHTEVNSKKEITGYDALYFTKDEDGISLWLGQAKAGQKRYCKKSIIEDLKEKYTKDYFSSIAFYIADKNEAPELSDLLNEINRVCYEAQINGWTQDEKIKRLFQILLKNKVRIKIPCLIVYSEKIYFEKNKLESYVESEVEGIINEFDNQIFPIEVELPYEIIFYIMPVEDIDYIREKIVEFKREAT